MIRRYLLTNILYILILFCAIHTLVHKTQRLKIAKNFKQAYKLGIHKELQASHTCARIPEGGLQNEKRIKEKGDYIFR